MAEHHHHASPLAIGVIFTFLLFVSFLSWSLDSLARVPTAPVFKDNQLNNKQVFGGAYGNNNSATDLWSGIHNGFSYLMGILVGIIVWFGTMISVMTFTNPMIPVWVKVYIIAPYESFAVLALISQLPVISHG